MEKSQKELAFLRDLTVQDEYTRGFTDLVDKHIDLRDSENMLYINAGTGSHAMAIGERFGEKTEIFASCENEDLLAIAGDKAVAVQSNVDFSTIRFEDDAFDSVLTDASLVPASEIESVIENSVRVARTGGDVAIFLPAAGSFGEIFSLLWEAFLNADLADDGPTVERLVAELPTVARLEEIASQAGLVNVNTETAIEILDYPTSEEFISSPLIADFFMPVWLAEIDEEDRPRMMTELARLIDTEDDSPTFLFSVKATLVAGEKG